MRGTKSTVASVKEVGKGRSSGRTTASTSSMKPTGRTTTSTGTGHNVKSSSGKGGMHK